MTRKIIDVTNQRFDRLLVLEFDSIRNYRAYWKCLCDCGIIKVVRGPDLRNGKSKSCGCLQKERASEADTGRKIIDLTGQRFERYSVLEFDSIRNHKVYWKCLCDCENVVIVRGDGLRSGHTKSCGCLHRERSSEANSGEGSPSYNPDITDEERQRGRFYPEYHEWRKAIFEKDNYTCQCCGKRGRKLAAHHLDGYDNFPELRTALENGITLCENCHKNFHHQYGRGNNTREQFEEFLRVLKIRAKVINISDKEFYNGEENPSRSN